MPSTPGFVRTALVLGLASAGCSAPMVGDVADANGGLTQGIVLVDRLAAAEGPTKTHVSVKFMRTLGAADPELAERMVGARLDLPAVGECRALASSPDETRALNTVSSIELLDVGDVTMRAGGSVLPLAARAFPDVGGDLVSGVFYTSRDAASDLPVPARYELESSGSPLLDRFSMQVEAPAAPQDVRVGDEALTDGLVLGEGSSAIVRWRAGQDLVYVDVSSATTGSVVRCTFGDVGEGTIPARALGNASAPFGALPAAVSLAVHRVRRTAFLVPGLDVGEARFDLSIVAHATIAAR